jgi:hypothetical protein
MTEDIPAFGEKSYGLTTAETGYNVAGYMGAKMVRLHTGRDASFSWQAKVDPFVADAVRRGFKPYLTLTYRHKYPASAGSDPGFLGVPTPNTFGAWCSEGATRYQGQVRDYGVFNEPNYFGNGMTPQIYNALYRACYAAIKQVDPTAKVYYGEIAADQDSGDPCGWVSSSLTAGNPTVADGLAIHTYQWSTSPNHEVPGLCRGIGRLADWNAATNFWLSNGQSLKLANGSRVPLLITEHGYCAPHGECPYYSDGSGANNRQSDATRATWAGLAFAEAQEHAVQVFSYYHLFEQGDGSNRWDTGIMTQSGSVRPAVSALRAATGSNHGVESDVNGDGLSDLVTLHSTGTASVYMGRFDETFGPRVDSFAGTMDPAQYDGTGFYVVDVSDVTGDKRSDLVTLTSGGTAVVYPGQTNGSFGFGALSFGGTMQPGLRSPGGHQPIGVADVTNDGKADFVSFYQPTGEVIVYPGKADGTFGFGTKSFAGTMNSALFDHDGHYFLDVADVTGDGGADLVTLTSWGIVAVYPGQTSGAFGSYTASFAGTMNSAFDDGDGHESLGLGDVNGDRRADLITLFAGSAIVYPGQPNGGFGGGVMSFAGTLDSSLFDGSGHEIVGALDPNGDGKSDLVTSHTSGNVYVYRGHVDSTVRAPAGASFSGTFASSQFGVTPGHQLAMEKPFWRRWGCDPTGCDLQP